MKALVFRDVGKMVVEEVPDPKIEQPGDCIVRVTSAAICGSDLHMYEGRTSAKPPMVFGHEILGVVEEVGSGVAVVKKGDRVSLPFNVSCGFCFNCSRGFMNACLTTNPEAPGGGYGYAGLGPYRGGQAQFVRVPFADYNCLNLPGTPHDQWENDFAMLADVFPTGYHSAVMAAVAPGKSVAIFGAGPVGYMAALSAKIMGASEIYVVDRAPRRLQMAAELGAVAIDFTKGDPVEQIMEMRKNNRPLQERWRYGEDKMSGVLCGIDAVGYQALDRNDPSRENPMQVINDLSKLVDATGRIGLIGVYFSGDPKGVDSEAKQGTYHLPLGPLWEKGITVETGQAPVKRYNAYLRDLIIQDVARPGKLVSHRAVLEEAADAYARFVTRGVGKGQDFTKIIITPNKA